MEQLVGSSITYRIAIGPQQGRKVFSLQTLPACDEPFDDGVRKVAGFSLHAAVAARADQRAKLERLCRYISRPAVAEKRLSLTPNGNVRYQLKTPYRDGTTHVIFEPLDDIETCPACGGAVRIIACIEHPAVIEKILTHLDVKAADSEVPRLPPCRAPPQRRPVRLSEFLNDDSPGAAPPAALPRWRLARWPATRRRPRRQTRGRGGSGHRVGAQRLVVSQIDGRPQAPTDARRRCRRPALALAYTAPVAPLRPRRRPMPTRLPLLALVLVALPVAAQQQVYRWVDADGKVTFSSTPAPAGKTAETVELPPIPSAEAVEAARQREQALQQLGDRL